MSSPAKVQRVFFDSLCLEFHRVLAKLGLPEERAALVARIFAENQRDGVQSHGLNRFPNFVGAVRSQGLDVRADPEKVGGLGALEQWDGKRGMGPWNAWQAMGRTVELARQHGMGCIGLRNTNHWMRGGTYGLRAAEAGFIGMCWTNTIPVMPAWGSAGVKIGNNPLVMAVPRKDGPLLLDMAMSQFSTGRLDVAKRQGMQLPVAGGYNDRGELTKDPAAILASGRGLPIGAWKGSALAVMLDAVATLVSGGQPTHRIGMQGAERSVSQVFIAIDPAPMGRSGGWDEIVNEIVDDLHRSPPIAEDQPVRYPGEGMLRARQDSLKNGVPVDAELYAALLKM